MIRHEISERRGNDGNCGEMAWIQPVCSCGWEGQKIHAWNNWQFTEVNRQKTEHLYTKRKEHET